MILAARPRKDKQMQRRKCLLLAMLLALTTGHPASHAQTKRTVATGQSSIILAVEGVACMGQTRSREDTKREAIAVAKRKAAEDVVTYISSETKVESGVLTSDLLNAYAKAEVRIIQQKDDGWFKETSGAYADECYRIRIKAEVIPDSEIAEKVSANKAFLEDPRAPLTVHLWTDKDEYQSGEKIKIYVKANKPFYGVFVYRDVTANLVQLLPNPYRTDNYFMGGVVYELPGGDDHYQLEVCPPVGNESVTLYASTNRLGSLELSPAGGVYRVKDAYQSLGARTRSVKLVPEESGQTLNETGTKAEFAEASVTVKTKK